MRSRFSRHPPIQNGLVRAYPTREQVVFTGTEHLIIYQTSTKMFVNGFCSRCGVHMMSHMRDDIEPEVFASLPKKFQDFQVLDIINLRTVNALDLSVFKTERVRGWDLIEPRYVNP